VGKRDYQLTTSTMSCAPRLLTHVKTVPGPGSSNRALAGTKKFYKKMILPLRAGSLGIRGAFRIFHHVFSHRSTAAVRTVVETQL
jgi:hypothetical protein